MKKLLLLFSLLLIFISCEKEDDEKYLNNWELRILVRRYSNYIQFPIMAKKADPGEDEDEWETLNDQVALWRKNPKEVTEEEYEGLVARIIQHEYDHIEGVLFTDYLSGMKKRLLKGRLNNISRGKINVKYKMRFPLKK